MTTTVLIAWLALLWLFGAVFPYCYSGSLEGTEAACYFGSANYGHIYHAISMFSLVVLGPVALAAVAVLIYVEALARRSVDAV